jgi:hypothetical protein
MAKSIDQLTPDLKKVLDLTMLGFAEAINNNVRVPGKVPYDTNKPPGEEHFVDAWKADGGRNFTVLDYKHTYMLTNNLPYAATITFDDQSLFPESWDGVNRLKSAAPDWFFVMMKSFQPDLDKALKKAQSQI